MTSTRKALALGALAMAAGLAGGPPAWDQPGGKAAPPAAPGATLIILSLGGPGPDLRAAALGTALGRPPVSQAIPGPVTRN
jgi:hypothetical protein